MPMLYMAHGYYTSEGKWLYWHFIGKIVEANAADCCITCIYSQDLTWMIFYSEKNIRYTSSFIFMIFFCFLMINEIIQIDLQRTLCDSNQILTKFHFQLRSWRVKIFELWFKLAQTYTRKNPKNLLLKTIGNWSL
jgi:hypothetical protein